MSKLQTVVKNLEIKMLNQMHELMDNRLFSFEDAIKRVFWPLSIEKSIQTLAASNPQKYTVEKAKDIMLQTFSNRVYHGVDVIHGSNTIPVHKYFEPLIPANSWKKLPTFSEINIHYDYLSGIADVQLIFTKPNSIPIVEEFLTLLDQVSFFKSKRIENGIKLTIQKPIAIQSLRKLPSKKVKKNDPGIVIEHALQGLRKDSYISDMKILNSERNKLIDAEIAKLQQKRLVLAAQDQQLIDTINTLNRSKVVI
ncbi:hypothetical protein KNT64_gp218 [Pseudomonas phage PspYZU05]|uniref:Uncharacterized protein n=1 Tax=Pseudomonas phage PspYZU05 TaxID=1983556 RepID=A0A2U7N2N0_9CAUD|nr:hypothetical protein KNT64_gp218 [Pseudomonas phage PspYZU05]ASD52170.1 hypothetical protein PspYZU05_218 [Pseudomonas phage PspYZU05]